MNRHRCHNETHKDEKGDTDDDSIAGQHVPGRIPTQLTGARALRDWVRHDRGKLGHRHLEELPRKLAPTLQGTNGEAEADAQEPAR